jgi:hypothetical protein
MKTREQARAYFRECGLTYSDIKINALKYLQIECDGEFNNLRKAVINGDGYGYWVRVNDAKYFKGQYTEDGHIICAFLTAKGTYFSAREVISFNRDGFIGFAAEASDINVQPVLTAFMAWCDWLKQTSLAGEVATGGDTK